MCSLVVVITNMRFKYCLSLHVFQWIAMASCTLDITVFVQLKP